MSEFSERFLLLNSFQTKNINIVVDIEGVGLFSNRSTYTYLRYGDKIYYGENYVYGGLRKLEGVLDVMSLERSSLTLSQKIEPEQGRSSISQMSFGFLDKNQEVTRLFASGNKVDDILGTPVTVWLGYEQCSFPEDYIVIFKGRISGCSYQSGIYTLSFSDYNIQKRENVFNTQKTKLAANITNTDTSITLLSTAFMYQGVTDPFGKYDCAHPFDENGNIDFTVTKQNGYRLFMKIEDEWIMYPPTPILTTTVHNCIRGQKGTTAVAHSAGSDVEFAIEFQDHAIDIALKIMLSGRADWYKKNLSIQSIVKTGDPVLSDQYNAIVLPSKVDAKRDYGLIEGDFVQIINASIPSNNVIARVVSFNDLNDEKNRLVYIDAPLFPEQPTNAKLNLRSQFDLYPKACGVRLTPAEVDVERHLQIKNDFLSASENKLRFFITSSESAKSFIETECMLPVGAYTLTRKGRLSVGYTTVPISPKNLVVLSKDNVIDAPAINVNRSLVNRRYFSEVDYEFNPDTSGRFINYVRVLNTESIAIFENNSILPIKSRGMRPDLDAETLIQKRTKYLFSRYQNAALTVNLKVNFETAALIEVGDVVGLKDNGELQLINFVNTERNIGGMLFEVINRSLDLRSGTATLELVSGFKADLTDRYCVISPSSVIDSYGSDSNGNYLILKKSYFGFVTGENENYKWKGFEDEKIRIHNDNFTFIFETRFLKADKVNTKKIYIESLPNSMPPNCIVNIIDYQSAEHSFYKSVYGYYCKVINLVSGVSTTQFNVSSSDIDFFKKDMKVIVHKENWTSYSNELKIVDIYGTTVVLENSMGFVPDSTYKATLCYFEDMKGCYRYIGS